MTEADDNDLRLIVTFHYVVAAFAAFFGLFPFIHLTLGVLMLRGELGGPGKQQPPEFVGYLFVGFAVLLITMLWATAGALLYGARCLKARRRHMLCMVVAGIGCLFMPFGTALGIYTLIVLQRPTVRAQFG
jgi:hypothetical protein